MALKLTPGELETLKQSLDCSIEKVNDSKNHSYETYAQRKATTDRLEKLKYKIMEMANELK